MDPDVLCPQTPNRPINLIYLSLSLSFSLSLSRSLSLSLSLSLRTDPYLLWIFFSLTNKSMILFLADYCFIHTNPQTHNITLTMASTGKYYREKLRSHSIMRYCLTVSHTPCNLIRVSAVVMPTVSLKLEFVMMNPAFCRQDFLGSCYQISFCIIYSDFTYMSWRFKSSKTLLLIQWLVWANNKENTKSSTSLVLCKGNPSVTSGFP